MLSPAENNLKLVVLDAANIGWAYGLNDRFSARGVQIAIEYFEMFPIFRVVTFLPMSYIRRKSTTGTATALMETEDIQILEKLYKSRKLSLVPAGDHDDVYILSYCREKSGFVVSNDRFQDHLAGMEDPDLQSDAAHWLRTNRCGYTFVGDEFTLNADSSLAYSLKENQGYCETDEDYREDEVDDTVYDGDGFDFFEEINNDENIQYLQYLTLELEKSCCLPKNSETMLHVVGILRKRAEWFVRNGQHENYRSDLMQIISIDPNNMEAKILLTDSDS